MRCDLCGRDVTEYLSHALCTVRYVDTPAGAQAQYGYTVRVVTCNGCSPTDESTAADGTHTVHFHWLRNQEELHMAVKLESKSEDEPDRTETKPN